MNAWRLLVLMFWKIKVEILAMRRGVEAVMRRRSRRRSPWIGELWRAGVRHVVEVHTSKALLIVDGHCHL